MFEKSSSLSLFQIAGAMAEDQIKSEKIAAVSQQINDCVGGFFQLHNF